MLSGTAEAASDAGLSPPSESARRRARMPPAAARTRGFTARCHRWQEAEYAGADCGPGCHVTGDTPDSESEASQVKLSRTPRADSEARPAGAPAAPPAAGPAAEMKKL